MSQLRTRLLGLTGVVALAVFVIGVPALLLAIRATPTPGDFTWSALTSPDDGTVALAVIGLVAWIAWAIFTASVVLDVGARVRGIKAPRLPGLVVPQMAAGRLVGVAALLFVSVPAIAAVAPFPRAAAAPPPVASAMAQPAAQPTAEPTPEATAVLSRSSETEAYTVRRGDNLWKIAKERLGDGTRYVELAELNRGGLDGEPDFLLPGAVLRVPVADGTSDGSYVVQSGDTLSEIAESELGDADAYPEIFDASRTTVQPDGDQLTDPDLIRPGWHLTLPHGNPPVRESPPKHRDRDPQPREEESYQPSAEPTPQVAADPDAAVDHATHGDNLPSWVLPGLAGGGAALAGSLLLVLRQRQRTQLRYRRPGEVIAPPPPELRPVEKSALASGSITAPKIEILDLVLRHLGNLGSPPRVVTATLGSAHATVELAKATDLPAPWSGKGTSWEIPLTDVPSHSAASAPYPLLVSVGIANDGALVFVNLEEIHTAVLTGSSERTTALGRHIAAELSLNPWSTLVEIDTIGIGNELADLDPTRLRHHEVDDTAFLDHLAADLETEDPAQEPDQFRALITTATGSDAEPVRKIAKIITSYEGRPGAAVLTIGTESSTDDVELKLSSGGNLSIETLGLVVTAASLSTNEARACATLIDITRETVRTPVPVDDPDSNADAGGALKPELTVPRPTAGSAGDGSLLPLEATEYEARGATTTDDVARLAPVVAAEAKLQVEVQDPQLDEDVARWQASRLMEPKLTLLGPVAARTLGDMRKMAHRRPFYVELLAYLALHPGGVTADELSEAFGLQAERARKDMGILRGWLGSDPRTGKPHLPNARQTHSNGAQGKYVVHGVATDLDLFRRLRRRGQSRGVGGIDDLRTALALVSGEPFTDLRPAGWGWLLEGERLDHIMSCAIVDTSHIVTTHALAVGDLDLARFAAEVAVDASPYDETAQLDLVAAGEGESADERLTTNVFNRSDDDVGPVAVPDRSAQIVRQRDWDRQAQRTAQ